MGCAVVLSNCCNHPHGEEARAPASGWPVRRPRPPAGVPRPRIGTSGRSGSAGPFRGCPCASGIRPRAGSGGGRREGRCGMRTRGVSAQVTEQGLAFDVAPRAAGSGGDSVKRETDRTAMTIRRSHGHWIPYVHMPWNTSSPRTLLQDQARTTPVAQRRGPAGHTKEVNTRERVPTRPGRSAHRLYPD